MISPKLMFVNVLVFVLIGTVLIHVLSQTPQRTQTETMPEDVSSPHDDDEPSLDDEWDTRTTTTDEGDGIRTTTTSARGDDFVRTRPTRPQVSIPTRPQLS